MLRILSLIGLLLLPAPDLWAGKDFTAKDKAYIADEMANDYEATDSTVNPAYKSGEPFDVRYLEIPVERLNVETLSTLADYQSEHLFTFKGKKKFVRFFIHPDSEHLYEPLIKEFGWAGSYRALPTASTRTVLARNPRRPDLPSVFLKLSLAQKQDDMSRIVPGWEVRRSVRITEARNRNPSAHTPNVNIIPEFAGVYLKPEEGIGHVVDKEQGEVFEHGFILRDASFLNSKKKVRPLFRLFSGKGGKPPIIEMWEKSGEPSFEKFVVDYFYAPFVEMNLPFMLKEGIVPQIHGQNVVLEMDPRTSALEKIHHRDVGSMKADYRLRWMSGLPVDPLQSPLADKDFGLSWGAEKIAAYHMDYLHDWVLFWGYKKTIQKYVPKFSTDVTTKLMDQMLKEKIEQVVGKVSGDSARDKILHYIAKNPPTDLKKLVPAAYNEEAAQFVMDRQRAKQSERITPAWSKLLEAKHGERKRFYTDYGMIFWDSKTSSYAIAFYDSAETKSRMKLLLQPAPVVSPKNCGKSMSVLVPATR